MKGTVAGWWCVICGVAAAPLQAAEVSIPSPPQVTARNYTLIDYATGQTLADYKGNERMEPASLTKLMTAYLVFQALRDGRLKLTDPITVSEHAWRAEGSRSFVQVGTQVPAEVLIKGMIVQSGNDASIALAERLGGTEPGFVEIMNTWAKRLGMTGSHFDDATGLPTPNTYTTAHDMALLASALVRDFPQFYPLFSLREFVWNNIKQQNRNGLLGRDPSIDGLKTGHTDAAGYCLVASAKHDNTRLIAVVGGSNSFKGREDASAALLNYGFTFYETVSVKKRGEVVLKPRVYKGAEEFVAVAPATDVILTVPRGAGSQGIQTEASVPARLMAPLDAHTAVGQLQVSIAGKPAASVPLYPVKSIPEGGLWSRLSDTVLLWLHK
jgi:D-alanyl-D-alanine carboxypeptidase (penicillin-binding protein 5/6)